jgi:hypothetical protein
MTDLTALELLARLVSGREVRDVDQPDTTAPSLTINANGQAWTFTDRITRYAIPLRADRLPCDVADQNPPDTPSAEADNKRLTITPEGID